MDCGDDAVFDDDRGILLAMGRDDATGAESVYHDADYNRVERIGDRG